MNIEAILKTKNVLPVHSRTIIHLMLVNNMLTEKIAETLKPFDMSLQQFNVLRILRGQQGKPANLFTIQERMISKMSNTTRLVDKLLKKGYVQRSICETNRRKVEIFITKLGMESLKKMDSIVAAAEKELLKNFDDQKLQELDHLLNLFEYHNHE
ncbi:MarR family winged helix-turn-helix transcriptional regulator [Ascidiimonas sp. W6]|uniref:MarR family winged helix-turn-helix transcriptional regulator n=1 Tax=Ascidiimonas meishanensis TaxID=3128903 RepID=UPI0030ED3ADA